MDESALQELCDSIPECYVESVWEIEFTDLDKQIDHESDFADTETTYLYDHNSIRRDVNQVETEDLDFEFFRKNSRNLHAAI